VDDSRCASTFRRAHAWTIVPFRVLRSRSPPLLEAISTFDLRRQRILVSRMTALLQPGDKLSLPFDPLQTYCSIADHQDFSAKTLRK
jgi:hypothetical protein